MLYNVVKKIDAIFVNNCWRYLQLLNEEYIRIMMLHYTNVIFDIVNNNYRDTIWQLTESIFAHGKLYNYRTLIPIIVQ